MALSYVLITPARNEEDYIELTLKSVVSQTLLPMRWVIINDGSTDNTAEIVDRYANTYEWIKVIHLPVRTERQFAAKVKGFNAGKASVEDIDYEVIGNLDADVSFEPEYFEYLMAKFDEIPGLGVAGTPFEEKGFNTQVDSFEGTSFVNGAVQMFRRQCFKDIGGYIPIKGGGIDWIAVTTARMRGWITRSFTDKTFYHHRNSGTGESSKWPSLFRIGRKDYFLGNHPLWEFFRCCFRMTRKPYVLKGLVIAAGYIAAFITRVERPISKELIAFHRKEEMDKLRNLIKHSISKRN